MSIKIVNWKLAVLALIFFCLFTSLGIWQLMRAQQKAILLKSFNERTQHAPFTAQDLDQPHDWRFYRVTVEGKFDQEHTFLLDNKTLHGKIGYEVYTPFKISGLNTYILVNRGFIPMGTSRQELPIINTSNKAVTITGMLNLPPAYVSLGEIRASNKTTWPLLVEYIDLEALGDFAELSLFPYILSLEAHDKSAYTVEWHATTTGPERNQGYALQWFALALTLLILFVALNRNRKKH